MNKLLNVIAILVLVVGVAMNSFLDKEDDKDIFEIEIMFQNYNYSDLKIESDIILIATSIQSADESEYIIHEENGIISEFYSFRQFEVIDVLKGNVQDEIIVRDYYVSTENSIYRNKDYLGIQPNKVYLLFLKESFDGVFIPISSVNSIIELSNISNYGFEDIAIKTILDFYSDYHLTESVIYQKADSNLINVEYDKVIAVETPYLDLYLYFDSNDNIDYIVANEHVFDEINVFEE